MNQTHFNKDVFFKCNHCGITMKESDFSISLFLYGGIFLHGKDDGYLGITCANPECKKTVLKPIDIWALNNLKESLFIDELRYDADKNPRFKYRAFPYFIKPFGEAKEWLADSKRYNLKDVVNCIDHDEHLSAEIPSGYYSSISHSDFALGPAIALYWYERKHLNQLLQLENESNIRVFPRFVIDDPLIQSIDDLCWDYELAMDFYMEMKLLIPIYDVRESISKQRITKNFDFLNILDMRHNRDIYATLPESGGFTVFNWGPVSNIARQSDGAPHHAIENQAPNPKLPPHDLMCSTLWENYEKQYIQDLLDKMSTDFIIKYIKINKEPNFTYNDAWSLKQEYLKEIYDYIISRKKRPAIKDRLSKSTQESMNKIDQQCPAFKSIVSVDKEIYEIKKKFIKLSSSSSIDRAFDILLLGESGTGKELFAHAYHEQTRPGKPFVPVNCGSISHDLFESLFFGHSKGSFTGAKTDKAGHFQEADGGTLFLDEIGELELSHQPRFLRVLETREIQPVGGNLKKLDFQIVFATNRDLYKRVQKNEFREDLYHRINRFPFTIPPLRQRRRDIPLLIDYFVKGFYNGKSKDVSILSIFTDEFLDVLSNYDWPGNVRELKNEIERILVLRPDDDKPIDVSNLSDIIRNPPDRGKRIIKPKGRKRHPGKEVLLQMKRDGLTHQEVANEFGVARETVTRWYSAMKTN